MQLIWKTLCLFAVITLGALLAVSCSSEKHTNQEIGKQKQLPSASEAIPVTVERIRQTVEHRKIQASGLLTTDTETRYSFKIGGIISAIFVEEGDSFRKGTLLATLNTTEIDTQTKQAELALEKAERDFARVQNLHRDSVATLEQLQDAETRVNIAREALEAVEFNKQYAKIYAKKSGFVTHKIANVGEVMGAGSPIVIVNESQGNSAWILQAGITDKEWASVRVGDSATVRCTAFPNQTFPARVKRKAQAADMQNGTFQVELSVDFSSLDASKRQPAVGMFATTTVQLESSDTLHAVGYSAVHEADGNNAFVFVPREQNGVRKVPVIISSFSADSIFVQSGLENVEQVIVSNSAFLNEQSRINIVQ